MITTKDGVVKKLGEWAFEIARNVDEDCYAPTRTKITGREKEFDLPWDGYYHDRGTCQEMCDLRNWQEKYDSLLKDAALLFVGAKMPSTSILQRRMKLGYNRCVRIMNLLEEFKVVGPDRGSKPRQLLISTEEQVHALIPY